MLKLPTFQCFYWNNFLNLNFCYIVFCCAGNCILWYMNHICDSIQRIFWHDLTHRFYDFFQECHRRVISKEEERIVGLSPMMIMVIMPQDGWPWTRITLPLVDSFLKGRSRMSHGDKMLTSQDITQRTGVNSASITLVSVSKASTAREEQNREQDGTFNCCLN